MQTASKDVSAKPDRIRSFADAFRLRKEEDDG